MGVVSFQNRLFQYKTILKGATGNDLSCEVTGAQSILLHHGLARTHIAIIRRPFMDPDIELLAPSISPTVDKSFRRHAHIVLHNPTLSITRKPP